MKQLDSRSNRMPQFELLRVISMLLIVMLHFMSHGGVNEKLVLGTPAYFIFSLFRTLAYLGVDCFILLSGYFLCESDFRLSRIVRTALQVLFYSCLGIVLAVASFHEKVGMKDLLFTLFPISGNKYWFASAYIVMLFISPLLNNAIIHMDKKEHLTIALILLISFSIIPTILFWGKGVYSDGKDLGWFITLYIIAAYVRKYPSNLKKKNIGVLFCTSVILTVVIEFFIQFAARKLVGSAPEKFLYYNNAPFVVVGGGIITYMDFRLEYYEMRETNYRNWRTDIWCLFTT